MKSKVSFRLYNRSIFRCGEHNDADCKLKPTELDLSAMSILTNKCGGTLLNLPEDVSTSRSEMLRSSLFMTGLYPEILVKIS